MKNITRFARQLRRDMPIAEKRLWRQLRSRQFEGYKFRRQYPVGKYIADFCCFERRLIVELDGGQHSDHKLKQGDGERTQYLSEHGFRVIRFWDNDVLSNEEGVLTNILNALKTQLLPSLRPSPQPSPVGRGRKKSVPFSWGEEGKKSVPLPPGEGEKIR